MSNPMHIRKNDRIVFFGDSITEQQLYTNYVETYLASRFPDFNLTLFNAGWGGDTATGGVKRLKRDVLFCKPTLVIVCFGMNDGGYCSYTEAIGKTFQKSMQELIRRLKKANVRIILLTPGFSDTKNNPDLRDIDYNNKTLRPLADIVLRLAKIENLPVFDIHALMNTVNKNARKIDPDFCLTTDDIHPNQAGHLVMAYGLLKALGVPPLRNSIKVDYTRGKVSKSKNIQIKSYQDALGIRLTAQLSTLPFFIEEPARSVLPYLPFEETYNNLILTVSSSQQKVFALRAGVAHIPKISPTQLRKGINLLSLISTPVQYDTKNAVCVLSRTNEKSLIYFRLWRNIVLNGSQSTISSYYNRSVHTLALRTVLEIDTSRSNFIQNTKQTFSIGIYEKALPKGSINNGDFITSWRIKGPYPAPFEKDHLDGEAVFSKKVPTLSTDWLCSDINPENFADCLTSIFSKKEFCTCYALVILESLQNQSCELLLGSDDGIAAWLNGELIENKITLPRGVLPDSDRIPVILHKGNNTLLLKISQYNGTWGFCARFDGLVKPLKVNTLAS